MSKENKERRLRYLKRQRQLRRPKRWLTYEEYLILIKDSPDERL